MAAVEHRPEPGTAAANQSPPFENVSLFHSDAPLGDALCALGVDAAEAALEPFGADWGSAAVLDRGRLANENPPRLRIVDAAGNRIDRVEFHPAYHALMAGSVAAGLHVSCWEQASGAPGRPAPRGVAARAARLYMAYQAEAGHICPITMTHAAVPALAAAPALLQAWLPKLAGRVYDPVARPWWEKTSVTIGMGMTERQGGTDVRTNETQAVPQGHDYGITGRKWFMSAPMCDAFLVLAQAPGGLTCFLLPRFRPDGALNGIRFQRLKDKLGNRSNASAEVEFETAYAQRLGEEGRGVPTIIEMVQWTRLDCAVASAGLMRFGLAYALHHARYRRVFGRRLLDQPVMRAVLADMALEQEGTTALVFRLADAFERAAGDPAAAAFARLLTPAVKYLVCKTAPGFLYEGLECLGGNGYVEELPLARAFREAPVNAVWEGSGNVMALDMLRAAGRDRDAAAAVIAALATAAGPEARGIADAIVGGLSDAPEGHARHLVERLARLAALAALARQNSPYADLYLRTRLQGGTRSTYGAVDLGVAVEPLLRRVLPD